MKKYLLSLFSIATSLTAFSQCNDLIISEYVEGTSNNKAIELFNPTLNPINLNGNYRLVRYNNGTSAAAGEANAQAIVNLGSHIIAANDAWVIVIDKRDPNGTGQEAPVDMALQAVADTFLCPDYNVSYAMYFNGNDAISLQKFNGSTWDYVDIFGKMGDAAMVTSQGWSDQFPYDGSVGEIWTKDHTLRRKASVMSGVTSNPSTFVVTTEWDSLLVNTYSGLGTHTCNCPVGIEEIDNSVQVNVYPNPSNSGTINFVAGEMISQIEIINLVGQVVLQENSYKQHTLQLSTSGLTEGVYLAKLYFDGNRATVVKISIQ